MGRWWKLGTDSIPTSLNQRDMVKLLTAHGWSEGSGGKHQVKMTKPGERPITLPDNKRRDYPPGLREAILKQAGITRGGEVMTFHVTITNEDGTLWATVADYPGIFAAGDSMDELLESLGEALSLVITPEEVAAAARLDSMVPPAPHHAEGRTLQLC